MIIDAHAHVLDTDLSALLRISPFEMLSAMDRAGVDAALLTNVSARGTDNSYACDGAQRHPGRFAVVGGVEHESADLEATFDALLAAPGLVGIRVVVMFERQVQQWTAGRYLRAFEVAERRGMPVCLFAPGRVDDIAQLARSFSGLQFVLDHLGLDQTPPRQRTDDPFERLPAVLGLARFPNIAVKLSAVPALSVEPSPFHVLRPHVDRVLDAFSVDRVMWGSDWTRRDLSHSYEETTHYLDEILRVSSAERKMLMGGTLRRIFRWEPDARRSVRSKGR